MAKYRKTALVEAEQFLPPHQIPEGCYQKGTIGDVAHGHGEWFLKTLEGEHPLRYADYICRGIQDERWNVERAIFEATYELAAPPVEGLTSGKVDATGWYVNPHTPSVIITPHGRISIGWSVQTEGSANDYSLAEAAAALIVQAVSSLAYTPKATATASVREEDLAWFWGQRRLSLQFYSPMYGDDDDQSEEWRVHKESGPINDREWDIVGRGASAAEAIAAARAALTASGTADTHAGSAKEAEAAIVTNAADYVVRFEAALAQMKDDPSASLTYLSSQAEVAVRYIKRLLASLHSVDSRAQGGEK